MEQEKSDEKILKERLEKMYRQGATGMQKISLEKDCLGIPKTIMSEILEESRDPNDMPWVFRYDDLYILCGSRKFSPKFIPRSCWLLATNLPRYAFVETSLSFKGRQLNVRI